MYKVLAISGGVDSVSLLHMMRSDPSVIVAHFNHGIRPCSDLDAKFVQQLAESYQLTFVSQKEVLGPNCSEAQARNRRYHFLKSVCSQYSGTIYTAHHKDDLIETIIINLLRGTGWRGLVPFGDIAIQRPLLQMTKNDIRRYAIKHNLSFRHDSTNTDDCHLRNRIRATLRDSNPALKDQILATYDRQTTLKLAIDEILQDIIPQDHIYQRRWFFDLDDNIASEILRFGLARVNRTATRPQLLNFLSAIRTYSANKKFNLSQDYLITLDRAQFTLSPPS